MKNASHPHGAGVDKRQLGTTIRELREMRGWTLNEMADRAELSSYTLREIELGRQSPILRTLNQVASALDLPLSAIIKDAEQQGVTL